MQTLNKPVKEFYSESETADLLGISLSRLHMLLDEFVFNDGSVRPAELKFRSPDLAMLGFWNRSKPNPKVVRMPRRY